MILGNPRMVFVNLPYEKVVSIQDLISLLVFLPQEARNHNLLPLGKKMENAKGGQETENGEYSQSQ
jgi:hypothetical protein